MKRCITLQTLQENIQQPVLRLSRPAVNVLCTDTRQIPCSVIEQDGLNDTAPHAFSDYCSTVHTGRKTSRVFRDI